METEPVELRTTERPITLSMSHDEGLVLFEFLARGWDAGDYRVEHSAEQAMLWQLQGILESWLVPPFKADYAKILGDARARLAIPED